MNFLLFNSILADSKKGKEHTKCICRRLPSPTETVGRDLLNLQTALKAFTQTVPEESRDLKWKWFSLLKLAHPAFPPLFRNHFVQRSLTVLFKITTKNVIMSQSIFELKLWANYKTTNPPPQINLLSRNRYDFAIQVYVSLIKCR